MSSPSSGSKNTFRELITAFEEGTLSSKIHGHEFVCCHDDILPFIFGSVEGFERFIRRSSDCAYNAWYTSCSIVPICLLRHRPDPLDPCMSQFVLARRVQKFVITGHKLERARCWVGPYDLQTCSATNVGHGFQTFGLGSRRSLTRGARDRRSCPVLVELERIFTGRTWAPGFNYRRLLSKYPARRGRGALPMPKPRVTPRRVNSNRKASGKPGAVHPKGRGGA